MISLRNDHVCLLKTLTHIAAKVENHIGCAEDWYQRYTSGQLWSAVQGFRLWRACYISEGGER